MNKQHLKLNQTDQAYLKQMIDKGSVSAKLYKRALALLELNRGKTYTDVAQIVGRSQQTVSVWAQKYRTTGLDFLEDKPRSGRPPEFDGTDRAKITSLACSDSPEGYSQWSLRLLASKAVELNYVDEISHTTVSTLLKKRT